MDAPVGPVVRDLTRALLERPAPQAPTWLERQMAARRAELERISKYPIRAWTVLTPEQLDRSRKEQLGAGRPLVAQPGTNRRPLTREELLQARAAAGIATTGWERD